MGGDDTRGDEPAVEDASIVAAIDRDGSDARLVIADVSRDDSWLSVPRSEAPLLDAWR
jgi:hypothetical protein